MSSRRYRTIAAALYHACEAGGGVVTIDKGEYEEDETLCFAGKITLRGRDGAKVHISGPKGKPVVHCEDPEARVLIIGVELSRIAKKNEQNPAVHIEPVDWNSCVRVSSGVVRLTDCKVPSSPIPSSRTYQMCFLTDCKVPSSPNPFFSRVRCDF